MPRLPRIHVEQGLYMVTTRGGQEDVLFRGDPDRDAYVDLLTKYKERYGFKLFSYVLMPSLIHLLLELMAETTISEVMHAVNSTYTKYYNGRYKRSGHLFKGRFKAAVVEKDTYLADLTRYIHLAPGIGNPGFKAEDYAWSSYSHYLEAKGNAKEVLEKFSVIPEEQVRLYKRFVEEAKDSDLKALDKMVQKSGIIGSAEFIEQIRGEFEKENRTEKVTKKRLVLRSRFQKVFIITGTAVIVALSAVTYYYYTASRKVEDKVEDMFQEREAALKQDLETKYRADLVSYYRATTKRLDRERRRREVE
ncbi:MAG: transposase [Candidatus Omnitrophica bacterium]|nr:transposase [Candidatus Omnitrophota bacterium]